MICICCTFDFIIGVFCFFFFNDTATTEIYTLSLHDALPICVERHLSGIAQQPLQVPGGQIPAARNRGRVLRSEEHTSELQSRLHLVCRLLLEKKKNKITKLTSIKTTPNYTITLAPLSLSLRH